jgi:Mg/Co/Ni transporter MgtE
VDAQHALATRYAASFPVEAARRLDTLEGADVAAFLSGLEPQAAAAVTNGMLAPKVAEAFVAMEDDRLSALLEHLSETRRVQLMRSIDRDHREAVMRLLPNASIPRIERLLRSPEGSVGALAEPALAVLAADMNVDEARQALHGISTPFAYVIDDDHRLIGVIARRTLATGAQRTRIGNLMSRDVVRLPSDALRSAFGKHAAWLDHDQLPVVDDGGVLIGVLRHKSLRRIGKTTREVAISRRPALATFLDLGELYWSGLESAISAMIGQAVPATSTEVKHES